MCSHYLDKDVKHRCKTKVKKKEHYKSPYCNCFLWTENLVICSAAQEFCIRSICHACGKSRKFKRQLQPAKIFTDGPVWRSCNCKSKWQWQTRNSQLLSMNFTNYRAKGHSQLSTVFNNWGSPFTINESYAFKISLITVVGVGAPVCVTMKTKCYKDSKQNKQHKRYLKQVW